MNKSAWLVLSALFWAILLPTAVGGEPSQPPRWVLADDVRVRSGPSAEHGVSGTLPRGAELILKTTKEFDGYCLIEGEGLYGYVACKYLSAERVARARAGEGGIDPAQRWVSGNGVTLREAPRQDAAVVGRLALNAAVRLLREEPGSGYCEVQPAGGASGFTACRYLAQTPVVLAHVRGLHSAGEALPRDFDPERAFWLAPGWTALVRHAEFLRQRHPGVPAQGPWPRDEALERMKAHLALGLKGPRPAPYPDWQQLKRKAGQDLDLSDDGGRQPAQGKAVPAETLRRQWRTQNVALELQQALGIWGPQHDAISADGAARLIRLVRALELPAVQPSYFRSEAEIAPPGATAEGVGGRFDIVFRQLLTPRPVAKPAAGEGSGAGLYDMLARTQALVRPVRRVQLFRDGRLQAEKSFVRGSETLWYEVDPPMCENWSGGFGFGEADAAIWRYFDTESPGEGRRQKSLNRNPPGSLFVFYVNADLPSAQAMRSESTLPLERKETGFVRGVYLHYDLDRDGIPDLTVWEGQGKGPGHLGGQTASDDSWYRLALVNINGAWKLLGSDQFSYGCGC